RYRAHVSGEPWEGPAHLYIPFVIEVSDSLIGSPQGAPRTSLLAMQPIIDPHTGEEMGDERVRELVLDDKETQTFREFILAADRMLAEINDYVQAWKFFETGLHFLVKANFSE